jgi:hypothetical protein
MALLGKKTVTVRLVFVDGGAFHHEEIEVPARALEAHARLIDCLRESPEVLARVHVDVARLCAAYTVESV